MNEAEEEEGMKRERGRTEEDQDVVCEDGQLGSNRLEGWRKGG